MNDDILYNGKLLILDKKSRNKVIDLDLKKIDIEKVLELLNHYHEPRYSVLGLHIMIEN